MTIFIMLNERNSTIDVLKLFASYMVVFIHILLYGEIGVAVDALARFAVPFFLLVSGYYSYKLPLIKIKKRIRHTFSLLAFTCVLYVFWKVAPRLIEGDFVGIQQYFERYLEVETIVKLVCFNVPVSSEHIWYLFSLLYVYFALYLATKCDVSEKKIFIISFTLLFLNLFMGEFLSIFEVTVPVFIIRNFALFGIPLFGIGIFIKKHEDSIKNIPNYLVVICLTVGIIETLFSRLFVGKNELYVGSLFILFAIVVIFLKYPYIQYPKFIMALTNCSTYIYILHIFVSSVLAKSYQLLGFDYQTSTIIKIVHPLLICLFSTISAYGINYFIFKFNAIKKKKTKEE